MKMYLVTIMLALTSAVVTGCEDDVLNAYSMDTGVTAPDGSMTVDAAEHSDGGGSSNTDGAWDAGGDSGRTDAGVLDAGGSPAADIGNPQRIDSGAQVARDTGGLGAADAGTQEAGTPLTPDAGQVAGDGGQELLDAGGAPGGGACGDGVLRDDRHVDDPEFEECDDGNLRAGDGCSPQCRLEGVPPLDCILVPGRDRRTSFCRGRRSFPDAQRACRLQSVFVGTVATVMSAQDNQILANILRRNQEGRGWIGLNDQRMEARLVWDGRPSRYVRFGGRGSRNSATNDCTFLRLDNENWQMGDCADANPFVCEEHPL